MQLENKRRRLRLYLCFVLYRSTYDSPPISSPSSKLGLPRHKHTGCGKATYLPHLQSHHQLMGASVTASMLMVEEGGVAPPSAEPYLGFIEYIYYTFYNI